MEGPTTPSQGRNSPTTTPPRAKPTLRQSTIASKGRVAAMMDSLQNAQNNTEVSKAPRAKPQRAAQAPEANGELPAMEILKILVQLQSEATRNRKVIEDIQNTIQQRDEVFQNEMKELEERFVQETQQLKEQLLQETQQLKEDNRLLQAQISQANSLISSPARSYATVARTSSLTPSASISQQASNTSTLSNSKPGLTINFTLARHIRSSSFRSHTLRCSLA